MQEKDIRTLRILEEIDKTKSPSQRYLAKKLNISLGLVNSFLKRLAQKGYFKIMTIPKNRVKYILTPKGVVEKTRLTYQYIHYSFQFYKDARQKLKGLFKEIDEGGMENIVFYGASDLAEIAYLSLQETSLQLKTIISEAKKEKTFLGFKIESPEVLDYIHYDIILITSIDTPDNLIADLLKRGIDREKIVTL
jgi:DNA-binding MarR family transcriptional regulator